MLSAYVSNLTAFLTIAKLEPHLESIDDLIRLQKINYSIVENSPAHSYIKNRANVEDVMYQKYKKMLFAEGNSTNRRELSVWDYPLNDHFTRMLRFIERNGFLASTAAAIEKIRESTCEKPFAFINGKQEVMYLDLTYCDLQEVGLEFSSRPIGLMFTKNSPLLEPFNSV